MLRMKRRVFMTQVNYKDLKSNGFMLQNQADHFSVRLRVIGGQITAKQLKTISEAAEKYGKGYVHITSRQSVEIPYIKLEDIEAFKADLADGEVQIGVCGSRVRTVTACQGNTVCQHGHIDTIALANEIDKRCYGRELPHKIKIGITGCRNNCLKADINDIGIKGGVQPAWAEENCVYCGACTNICPAKAIHIDKSEKTLNYNEDKCVRCGKCVKVCPKNSWTGREGYVIYFGGLFGNTIAIGKQIIPIVFSTEEVYKAIDVTLDYFAQNGKKKERFYAMLERIGWAEFTEKLKATL